VGVLVASELAGSQITTLMEALPGIATVLRSPVADAMIGMIRAAARIKDFSMAEADELIKYATRRGLLGNDEGERVLAEAAAAEQKRQERLTERDGTRWEVDEAAYVAFSGKRTVVPVVKSDSDGSSALADARARLFDVLDGIAGGVFPPRPHDEMICRYCAYPSVCRKDYVDQE